jgi:hypothetical protein
MSWELPLFLCVGYSFGIMVPKVPIMGCYHNTSHSVYYVILLSRHIEFKVSDGSQVQQKLDSSKAQFKIQSQKEAQEKIWQSQDSHNHVTAKLRERGVRPEKAIPENPTNHLGEAATQTSSLH